MFPLLTFGIVWAGLPRGRRTACCSLYIKSTGDTTEILEKSRKIPRRSPQGKFARGRGEGMSAGRQAWGRSRAGRQTQCAAAENTRPVTPAACRSGGFRSDGTPVQRDGVKSPVLRLEAVGHPVLRPAKGGQRRAGLAQPLQQRLACALLRQGGGRGVLRASSGIRDMTEGPRTG